MNDFIVRKAMGGALVRIYRVPQGRNVTLDIRAKWIGVVLPVEALGIIDGDPEPRYFIDAKSALAALNEKSPRAAAWWKAHGPFPKGTGFIFRKKDTMLVENANKDDQDESDAPLEVPEGYSWS